jgi:hypothetical protein
MIPTGPFSGRTGPVEFFNRPDRTGIPFSNRFQLCFDSGRVRQCPYLNY